MKFKKSLIAVAALAATGVYAQSTATVYGLVDQGINVTDFKGNSVTTAASSNGSATSHLGFKGTEDLGGGMQAVFQLEATWSVADSSNRTQGTSAVGTSSNVTSWLGNSQSFVGLSGGFGSVKFGAPNSATLNASGIGNGGFSTAIGSGYRVTSFDAVRFQNSLRYDTPVMNGLSLSLLAVTKNDKQTGASATSNGGSSSLNQTAGRDGLTEIGVAYSKGPLNVQLASLSTTQDSLNGVTTSTTRTGGKFNLTTLGVGYKPGAVGVSAFWQRANSDSLYGAANTSAIVINRTAWGLGVQYDANAKLSFKLNYQVAQTGSDEVGASASSNPVVASQSTTVLGLGADYALSKRTSIYARYEADQDGAGLRAITGYTSATGNSTYTAMAIGVRHSF